jgi:transposase InsO family protein
MSKIPAIFLCKYFSVSTSGFYQWKKELGAIKFQAKKTLYDSIKEIFKKSKDTYGSPRIYQELKDQGIIVSENTVAKYMKELGLDARLRKKFSIKTTDSNHSDPIAPRLFKVEEENNLPDRPGKLLAGDITYLRVGQSFLYLAIVLDLYNREVVGWSMSRSLETKLILDALDAAMKKVGPNAEIIFHSDRGSQYASEAYRKFLKNYEIKPSMSRRGNCYDNAYVESWFAALKKEWIYRQNYSSEAELRTLVFEYIETWYNKKRKHSSLGYLSPEGYKLNNYTA